MLTQFNAVQNSITLCSAIPIKVDETLVQFDYFMVQDGLTPNSDNRPSASQSGPESLLSTTVVRAPYLPPPFFSPLRSLVLSFDQDEKQLPEVLASSIRISERIQEEDAWVSQMVQEGLNSRAYDVGRYAPNVEMGAYAFHQLLSADYHRDLAQH